MHFQDVTECSLTAANCTPAEDLPKDFLCTTPSLNSFMLRYSKRMTWRGIVEKKNGKKKRREKTNSNANSYLLWMFVEKGWILSWNFGRFWFSSGSNYSERRWILYERERENTHNSQGVLTGYAIKLISDISGQWERIKMKFMFDIYKFLRSWSSKVGCDSASAPQLLVRQEVNF